MVPTMSSDSYLALCERARDALREMLMQTEPDLAMAERDAYSSLKKYIARFGGDNGETETKEPEPERWGRLPIPQRQAHVLEHLDEARLTISELTDVLEKALHVDYRVYENWVRNTVNRMYKEGRLHREGERWHSRIRYRYYIPRELEGPIAELQAQFDSQTADDSEGKD
jgi:hypothetical protein